MARKKKTRRITDIMPIRKADKKIDITKARSGKSLHAMNWMLKLVKIRKNVSIKVQLQDLVVVRLKKKRIKLQNEIKDPKIGSKKKVPLVVEFINKPEKGQLIPVIKQVKNKIQ